MAVDDVGLELADQATNRAIASDVGKSGIAVDRRHGDAELRGRRECAPTRLRRRGQRASPSKNMPTCAAARALFGRQIDDVAEQAAERRAKNVNDLELPVCASSDAAISPTSVGDHGSSTIAIS